MAGLASVFVAPAKADTLEPDEASEVSDPQGFPVAAPPAEGRPDKPRPPAGKRIDSPADRRDNERRQQNLNLNYRYFRPGRLPSDAGIPETERMYDYVRRLEKEGWDDDKIRYHLWEYRKPKGGID